MNLNMFLYNILIANEVVDDKTCKMKKGLLLFKMDFEKAYDSVDWRYLDVVMGKMNFLTLWQKWMKECVGSATLSVLVNNNPTNEFPLEMGLRQGDPFSPFLFILVVEGLDALMFAMIENGPLKGY